MSRFAAVSVLVLAFATFGCKAGLDGNGGTSDAGTLGDDGGGAIDGGGGNDAGTPDLDPPHLPYDTAGWTVFPTDYAVTIYVDAATGSDTNPGTVSTAPIKSLAQAGKLINARAANTSLRIAFKRGGSWAGQSLAFTTGGDVADHPLLLDGWSYGDSTAARPIFGSIAIYNPGARGMNHIAMVGLYVGPGAGAGSGINYSPGTTMGGTDVLIEDCVVDGFNQNIDIAGASAALPLDDFKMRRSQSINSYDVNYLTNAESKPQGLYAYAITNALLEENVFDHNAYFYADLRDATEFGHDIYISNAANNFSYNVIVRANLISRGLHSVKGPAAGTFDGNLIYAPGFGGYLGPQGGAFANNVVFDNTPKDVFAMNIKTSMPSILQEGGYAIDGNMSAGSANLLTTVADNLFAHGASAAFSLAASVDAKLAFTGNVIADWQECLGSSDSSVLTVSNNQCQGGSAFKDALNLRALVAATTTVSGNTYYGAGGATAKYFVIDNTGLTFAQFMTMDADTGSTFAQVTYPTPTVDLVPYLQQLPGGAYGASATVADFITAIEAQSRYNWRQTFRVPVVTNYLRAGYAMAAVPVAYAASN